MIHAIIRCDRCDAELVRVQASSWRQLALDLPHAILVCHSAQPHTSHGMSFAFEEDGLDVAEVHTIVRESEIADLEVECLHEHCGLPRRTVYSRVPLELVGAHVMAFHTAHEGHRMRVSYGERSWESPGKELEET